MSGFFAGLLEEKPEAGRGDQSGWSVFPLHKSDTGLVVDDAAAFAYEANFTSMAAVARAAVLTPPVLHRIELKDGRRVKHRAEDHYLWPVLRQRWNEEMTYPVCISMLLFQLQHHRRCFIYKRRDPLGRVRELWPLPKSRVRPARDRMSHELYYEVSNFPQRVPRRDMIDIRSFTWDGLNEIGSLSLNGANIAIGLALEKFLERWLGQTARPGAVLEREEEIPEEDEKKMIERWKKQYWGLLNAGGLMVAGGGGKVKPFNLPWEDDKYQGSGKANRIRTAAGHGVPPHKIGETQQETYNNVEHQERRFSTDALAPNLEFVKLAMQADLIEEAQRPGEILAMDFQLQGLLRADTKTRWFSYAIGLAWGVYSINDVRGLEGMNPIEGGDDHRVPQSHATLDEAKLLDEMRRMEQEDKKGSDELLSMVSGVVNGSPDQAHDSLERMREFLKEKTCRSSTTG